MIYDSSALRALEDRYERLLLLIGDMQAAIGRLQQPAVNPAQNPQSGGSGSWVYSMVGQVISAGGNATGVTVNAWVGGIAFPLPGTYKVYNQMQAATVVTKTIMLGANPDGTFSAISQSC